MTIEEAEIIYDQLLHKTFTPEEYRAALAELSRTGRASGYYRPARDVMEEGDPYP